MQNFLKLSLHKKLFTTFFFKSFGNIEKNCKLSTNFWKEHLNIKKVFSEFEKITCSNNPSKNYIPLLATFVIWQSLSILANNFCFTQCPVFDQIFKKFGDKNSIKSSISHDLIISLIKGLIFFRLLFRILLVNNCRKIIIYLNNLVVQMHIIIIIIIILYDYTMMSLLLLANVETHKSRAQCISRCNYITIALFSFIKATRVSVQYACGIRIFGIQ